MYEVTDGAVTRYYHAGGQRIATRSDEWLTGQASYAADFGLLFYQARWYDPYLKHFVSPDSLIPDPYNSLDYNRYDYARSNPLKYTDPSGHEPGDYCDRGYCTDVRDLSSWMAVVSVDAAKSVEMQQLASQNAVSSIVSEVNPYYGGQIKYQAYKDFADLVGNEKNMT
jgi:RHS repeat-associated protein